ncbi:hypothetical protein OROMI_031106 [Orobanche minor]
MESPEGSEPLIQNHLECPKSFSKIDIQNPHCNHNIEIEMDNQNTISLHESTQTHLIEDIDGNGYLVNHEDSENELEKGSQMDMDFEFDEFNGETIVGKVFDTLEDAYTFYNRYAFLHGFGIRIHWEHKNKITNEPYRKMYVCNKQGFKRVKVDSSGMDMKKRRRDLRTGCEAVLRVSKTKDGKWVVDKFYDIHNHDLTTTPTKVMKHHSHGKFHRSMACKSLMAELGQSGLRPSQIKKAVNAMKSPYDPDVTSKQCADILSEQRKQYKGKEFYGLIKYFQDKASVDINQYFVVDLFDDGSPRNIFWADGRSRDSYIKFGDVVVFDVTYMTNKFKMPFAPFIGVNHHGQSILFGGALLENEKEETFEWLFENFLKCMFSKYPRAIITDQDKAMGNAIKKVFPKTRHRYCAWHIKKHEAEHLRPFIAHYSDFEETYRKWIKSDTIEEFETQWESIHSFFDGYVNSNTMLNEFVIQYDKAVDCRRAAEEDEDFKSMNSRPALSSVHPIEAKAGRRYTRKIFELFQKEWKEATNNLTHDTLSKSIEQSSYRVGQVNAEKFLWRIVKFHFLDEVDVTCSCAKFETHGILCKHILYMIKKKHVETLPNHYILPRWTLDVRYKVGNSGVGLEEMNGECGVSALNLWCVHANCTKAIEEAKDSLFEIKRLNTFLVKFLEEQMIRKKPTDLQNTYENSSLISQVDMMPQISIRDPLVHNKTKGRPKSASRIKSFLEVKKKRICSHCKGLGHYITGCPQKKVENLIKEKE